MGAFSEEQDNNVVVLRKHYSKVTLKSLMVLPLPEVIFCSWCLLLQLLRRIRPLTFAARAYIVHVFKMDRELAGNSPCIITVTMIAKTRSDSREYRFKTKTTSDMLP